MHSTRLYIQLRENPIKTKSKRPARAPLFRWMKMDKTYIQVPGRCMLLIMISTLFVIPFMIPGVFGCDDPGTPTNGVRDPPESGEPIPLPPKTVIHFSCDEGYLLDGPPKIICTKENKWLPEDRPSCIAVDPCSHNPCQNGATCVDTITSITRYYCHCPPIFHGDQCEQRMDCALPPDVEVPNSHYIVHGQESDSEGWYLPSAMLEYKCDTGFIMQGGLPTRQCQSGHWVGEKPQCVEQASCDDPGWPVNSQRCCQYIFFVGVKLSFYCNEGYNISGSDERTCLTSGQWSGVQPVCNEIITPPTPEDSNMFNTETLTIVMATTGSILGILVVTVILTSRQCRSRRHHVAQTYPPVLRAQLARLHRDPDALALLAVTDDIGVVLPSYDEAVAPIQTAHVPPFRNPPSSDGNDQSPTGGEENRSSSVQGRPLPPIPPPPPHQNSSTRAGRPRRQRAASRQQTLPSPPPYVEHEDPPDVVEDVEPTEISPLQSGPVQSSQARRAQEEVMQGGEGPSHSLVGNDLYAEVPHRRAESQQRDGAHYNNSNALQDEHLEREDSP